MYKLIYYSDFKNLDDEKRRIEIYKNTTDNIVAKELLLTDDAVSIHYQGEEIYKAVKQSSCTVNIYTNDVLPDLYNAKIDDVMIKVYKDNSLFWVGYLTPNLYDSEYNSEYDQMSLEFIDTLAQLENTKFKKSESLITTFYDIISRILDKVDSQKLINTIYLHNVLKLNDSSDILKKLYALERNFYDEEDEAQSNKEVIEDILTYLNMTIIQFKNAYFIIDYDALAGGNYSFTQYDRNNGSSSIINLTKDIRTVSSVGIHETNGSIALGDVYNKINVRAVSNPIEDIIPQLFDCLTNQNSNINKYYEKTMGEDEDKKQVYLSAYFNSCHYTTHPCEASSIAGSTSISEVTLNNVDSITVGSFFQKNDSYPASQPEPSSISWDDVLTIAGAPKDTMWPEKEFLALSTTVDYVMFKRGYFILDFEYLYNNNSFSNFLDEDKEADYRNNKFTTDWHDTLFMCRLRIGDWYFDGETWRNWYSDYLPYKDLYENCMFGTEIDGKEEKIYYIYNGEKVYISEMEYRKMRCGDKFYLAHKNKEGDKVYNTWKHLTNQVSYKLNLVNSDDGALIPLPTDKVLFGELKFDLYAPNDLSDYANPRTADTSGGHGGGTKYKTWVRYCHIKNLKFFHTSKKSIVDIFNEKQFEEDVLYSNTINDEYVQEMDDVDMRVNTYDEKVSSYSYVIYKFGSAYDFVDKLYNKNYNEYLKMEEAAIKKYVNRYSTPKFEYSNTLKDKDITPLTVLQTMGRNFVQNDLEYLLNNNAINVKMLEI